MKKILMFLHDGVGGAERITTLIGKEITNNNFRVVFCLVDRGWNPSIKCFIPDNFKIITIPNVNPILRIWEIIKVLIQEKPEYVFSSVMSLNTKLLFISNLFQKIKFVIRCDNYLFSYNRLQKLYIRFTYKKANAIVAQTIEMKDELVNQMHIDSNKIMVLQNPVDEKLIKSRIENADNPYPNNGMKHFVASGRFVKEKGFDILIQSFCMLATNNSNIDLYIIGNNELNGGEILNFIQKFSQENGISERVHCVGFQDNPYKWIKFADCFVLSSRLEGLPNVLIEALYLGIPCAATKCVPVIEKIIEEGKTGFLAENGNALSLADAMGKSIELGYVKSTYVSSTIQDFEKLFC